MSAMEQLSETFADDSGGDGDDGERRQPSTTTTCRRRGLARSDAARGAKLGIIAFDDESSKSLGAVDDATVEVERDDSANNGRGDYDDASATAANQSLRNTAPNNASEESSRSLCSRRSTNTTSSMHSLLEGADFDDSNNINNNNSSIGDNNDWHATLATDNPSLLSATVPMSFNKLELSSRSLGNHRGRGNSSSMRSLAEDAVDDGGGDNNDGQPAWQSRSEASSLDRSGLGCRRRSLVVESSFRSINNSGRRVGLISSLMTEESLGFMDELEMETKGKDWLRSFRDLDPRIQILQFFNGLSLEGVEEFESQGSKIKGSHLVPKILRGFIKCGQFSVWRPTSSDAIRNMMTGEGTGKGLDIKGKSAKSGEYSGFVPYLQIHENEHKKEIKHLRADKRVRVFYPNESSRDVAADVLAVQSNAMTEKAQHADQIVEAEDVKRGEMLESVRQSSVRNISRPSLVCTRNIDEALNTTQRFKMFDPLVHDIDDYACNGIYGLDIPEKLFWETYVVPNDISRPKGSKFDTGRPSMPDFQQMNIQTLRKWSDESDSDTNNDPENVNPRPVLWHGGCGRLDEEAPADSDPLCPLGLLMAYEENGKVIPVVSDFDCFLVGTRGVQYQEPLGMQELSTLSWCLKEIGSILARPEGGKDWTKRWLEVKKKHVDDENVNGEMPKFGFADPRSYSMMKGAVHHLRSNGAVRHGPECFNYCFPQELDDYFLVISDSFPDVPWRYTNGKELIDILSEKIDEGFTFPLNPKWILCDPGWKEVYDKLLLSQKPNVQPALNIWYPDIIRRQIHEISAQFPEGFIYSSKADLSSGVRFDLAQLELERYRVRLSSRRKLREAFSRRSLGTEGLIYSSKNLSTYENPPTMSVAGESDVKLKTKAKVHSNFLATVKVVQLAKEMEREKKKRRSSSIFIDLMRGNLVACEELPDEDKECDEDNSNSHRNLEDQQPRSRRNGISKARAVGKRIFRKSNSTN